MSRRLRLSTAYVRSPAFRRASATARAAWLGSMGYIAEQGLLRHRRITGAAKWSDRQWLQAAGVTAREARKAAPLLRWRGGDVVVRLNVGPASKSIPLPRS